MKNFRQNIVCAVTALTLMVASLPPAPVFAADSASPGVGAPVTFVDVPQDSWAIHAINLSGEYGLMAGREGGRFGYGEEMTKAEFVTILCKMFKWQPATPAADSFSDVKKDVWHYSFIETALAHKVMDKTATFSPNAPITREQAAVMFVRALGLSGAAKLEESTPLPFTDVASNKGYIAVARSIGMISGTSATTFHPTGTATREQIASMLTQIYSKYYDQTDFLHGFYAISSYSQKDLTKDMDAVTLVWSTMTLDEKGAWLNTAAENSNRYKVPDSYADITNYLDSNGTKAHLGVYMDTSGGLTNLLTNAESRTAAVNAIIAELTKSYETIGKNPYSGVTIDFEGLKGADAKQGLNEFLTALCAQLKPLNKTLYVAVQPALPDGVYYDGFDFKTIGALADKVILMAHDYNPTNLSAYVGTEWHKNASLTPIGQVYYALKAATNADTGVADKNKLALAISFAGLGWRTSADGKLLEASPVPLSPQTIASYLSAPGTVTGFSEIYRNPYLTYTDGSGSLFVWYENSQSVFEKAALARLFSVNGISLWRLGNIPNFPGYDVTDRYK